MDIGRTKIVVDGGGARGVVVMSCVAVVMVVIVAQQPGADEIDAKAEHRDRDGLAIGDRHRMISRATLS